MVRHHRVAYGDVPREAFGVTELAPVLERRGKLLLHVTLAFRQSPLQRSPSSSRHPVKGVTRKVQLRCNDQD